MWWLLLAYGIIREVCGTICMKLSDGGVGSVSFMYHGGTGCTHMRQGDIYGGIMVLLLGCDGEMRSMKSLCVGAGLIVVGFGRLNK